MKNKIEAVIFDWAGTTVDYGCFAPLEVFIEIFKEKNVEITYEEARKPMGLLKRDHIKTLLEMPRIKKAWEEKYKKSHTEEDIDDLYKRFESILFEILKNYAEPVPGLLDLVADLRKRNIKIGSTTGYTREMIDIVVDIAKTKGYSPDYIMTPTETGFGRPAPFMVFENMKNLGVTSVKNVIKIGDTISDIKEGVNAGVITVGILKGSNEMGLTLEETNNLSKDELERKMSKIKNEMMDAGANYVVDEVIDLIKVIDIIEGRN